MSDLHFESFFHGTINVDAFGKVKVLRCHHFENASYLSEIKTVSIGRYSYMIFRSVELQLPLWIYPSRCN